jgi:hypothetical protein
MREIAEEAAVSWDTETIVYRGNAVGYQDGDSADVPALKTASESVIGFGLVEVEPPSEGSDR